MNRYGLAAILSAYTILSLAFQRATPPMEASDEAGHASFVFYLREHRHLPICRPGQPLGPGPQEFTQAPLYYALGALLVAPIDVSNAGDFFVPRPGAPIGRADLAGPRNGWEIRGDRSFPYSRTMLAVTVLRLFSMALGLCTLLTLRFMLRFLGPDDAPVTWLAMGWVAFNPMFLFVSSAVNNDVLVVLASTAALASLLVARERGSGIRADLLVGLLLGIAVLSKVSAVMLVPVVALGYLSADRTWRGRLLGLGSCALAALVLCGPWLAWNQIHYGDPLALSIHRAFAHVRDTPAPLALLREWSGFVKSYWGVFGMFNVIFPDTVYRLFYGLSLLSLFSVARALVLRTMKGWLPLLLTAHALLVLASVAYWTHQVWASQGRLLFPALAAHALLTAGSIQGWRNPWKQVAAIAIPAFLFATACYAAWVVIPGGYL